MPEFFCSVAALAQEAQQVQKQVDKVQIQLQRGEDGRLFHHIRIAGVVVVVLPDALGVVGGVAQKHRDADEAHNGVKGGESRDEQAHQSKHHQEDQAGEQDGTDARQVPLGKMSIGRQHAEVQGSGQEYKDDAVQPVHIQIDGQGKPEQGGEGHKNGPGRPHRHLLNAGGHGIGHDQGGNQHRQLDKGRVHIHIQRQVGNPSHHRHAKGNHQTQHHPQEGPGGILPFGDHPPVCGAVVPVKFIGIKAHRKHSFPEL